MRNRWNDLHSFSFCFEDITAIWKFLLWFQLLSFVSSFITIDKRNLKQISDQLSLVLFLKRNERSKIERDSVFKKNSKCVFFLTGT